MHFRHVATIKAKHLEVDDWFKLAGKLYRIIDIITDVPHERIIHFHPAKTLSTCGPYVLIVPKNMKFKIYNQ